MGESVWGSYGAGVVQFFGDYSSISFKDPVFKYYTFITVGDEDLVDSVAGGVPELSTWAMILLGFVGLGFVGYRQTQRAKPQAAA
jgi:hypothetical protein